MKNRELTRQIQRLQEVVRSTQAACADNIEVQSHWAKYLCIISAGLLENSLKELYAEYAESQVSKPVARFVNSKLSQVRNPKASVFIDTADAFSSDWRNELESFMAENGRSDAIDSIINNRHLIAHGKEKDSGVTVSRVKEWIEKSIEVLEYIECQCKR